MSLRNTATTYGSVAKFFHWLIFLLLLLMITLGYCLDLIPKDYKSLAYNTHKLTGLTILALMLLRLCWVFTNPKPQVTNAHLWERFAERAVQILLYVVVIAMPLVGWIGSSAANKVPHLGPFSLRLPIEENKSLSHSAFDVHSMLAIAIIVLVSIHVLAALYHHFVKKDDVLRRMMPHSSHH